MGFRFRCPKCHSTSFSIERDSRSYAARGQIHELVFSCRCGKQLFGEQIEQEYLRQKSAWEAEQASPKAEPRPKKKRSAEAKAPAPRPTPRARATRAATKASEAAQREEASPEASPEAPPTAPSREEVAPAGASEAAAEPARSKDGTPICGWKDCNNPARPNSKYCSRDCSNKNARYRYKRRKGRGREAA